jgi:hypothetical protein
LFLSLSFLISFLHSLISHSHSFLILSSRCITPWKSSIASSYYIIILYEYLF